MARSGLDPRAGEPEEVDPEVTDVGLLVTPQPRGLGLDVDDRSLAETLRKNPESLSKEAVQHLLKKHFITSISKKVFAVKATSLPNIVRAIARLLSLANVHNRKMWEEFRGSGALEELMTRMGVMVGEEHLALATDLLSSLFPLLYVGDGVDASEDSGIEFMDKDKAGGGMVDDSPSETRAEPKVKNKYVYQVLVRGFEKMATLDSKAHLPAFISYCITYLDGIMRVIAAPGNLEGLMSSHPLVPIFERLGELPTEVAYKACRWMYYICKANRCAAITEFTAIVEAVRLVVAGSGGDSDASLPSFHVYNLFRSVRYLVVSTLLINPKFKFVWYETNLLEHLLVAVSGDRPNVAPFTVSLAVDTILWLVRGCTKNARMVAAGGGKKAVEFLLSKDTHFAEGNALWVSLMRELAVEVAQSEGSGEEEGTSSRDFVGLLLILLKDLDRRFLTGAFDDSTGDVFSNGIAAAYAQGLKATAEGMSYTEAGWDPATGRHPPPVEEGKTFQQCIMTLHAIITLLVPDQKEMAAHPSGASMGGNDLVYEEISHDEIGFVTPVVLLSIRRHRGQSLRWLTVKPSSPPAVVNAFQKILRVRRAFIRAGAVERVLGVLERCVAKLEHDEWPLSGLCLHGHINFNMFASQDEASLGRTGSGFDNTTLAEFLGCSMVIFSCAVSRLKTVNCLEGVLDGVEGDTWAVNPRLTLAAYRSLAALLFRLLRKTQQSIAASALSVTASEAGGGQHASSPGRAVPVSIFNFLNRFLLSTALGGHSQLIEHVLGSRSQTTRDGGPPAELPVNLSTTELYSPRGLLLVLELMVEYPMSRPDFDFLVPQLQSLADLLKRLLRAERNLEIALDAGLVKSLLWAATRPAAAHPTAEDLIVGLLHHFSRFRVSPEELRIWLNIVLSDYGGLLAGADNERIEQRRLRLLRTLVEVSNGHLPGGDRHPDYLQRSFGHVFGSAALVAFDPTGDDRASHGPRLSAASLYPEGLEDQGPSESASRLRPWPPAKGYTFSAWLCIESYGPFSRHLPVFSLSEDGDVVTAVDIHEGILRLVTGSSKDKDCVARCETVAKLAENTWYHVTIVHHKSRSRSSSADVFINGARVASQLKLNYPRPTAGLHRVKCLFGQSATSTGSDASKVKWLLGPTYLLNEPLPDQAVTALFATGPWSTLSFYGEDGQGSVPLSVDILSPSQLRAFGGHGGLPYFAPSGAKAHGTNTLGVGGGDAQATAQMRRAAASSESRQFTDQSAVLVEGTGISVDMVVLALASREASETPTNLEGLVAYSLGTALPLTLSGGAIGVIRRRVGDSLRHACQVPLMPAMMLAERADSVEELKLSLEFLVAMTHANPWNVQQMEKGHYYAVLSQLLRRKSQQGLVVEETVQPLLAMVGRLRLTAPEGVRPVVVPLNVQALQHLVLSFDIWKRANPHVHKLIIKSLQDAVALTDAPEGEEPLRMTQEFNLKRFQASGITRAFLYMLIEPEIKYDLLLNMCDLLYLVLTRNREAPPLDDLHAVAYLVIVLLSPRFTKLYVDQQQMFGGPGVSSPRASKAAPPPGGKDSSAAAAKQAAGRHARLKVIRRSLLRLLLKVAETYVARGEAFVHALLRALPVRYILYTAYHFGDVVFWAGTAASRSDGQLTPAKKPQDAGTASLVQKQRHPLRRHDPVSATLAVQLLVLVMPLAFREVLPAHGFRVLQVGLPSIFKSVNVHTEHDMPSLGTDCETWGHFFIWNPKRLRIEREEVSAFFGGQPIADATSSICSPPYQASLYVVYRSLFATLFGTDGHFSTIEMALDTAHHRDLPQAVIQCPAMLPTILHTISTAASMSTVDGLSQVIHGALEARQAVKADHIDTPRDFLLARSAAAKHVAERSLRLLVNLHVKSGEMKELLRGEVPATMAAGGVGGGVLPRYGKLPKTDELISELVQIYYSGLCASLAQHFKPKDRPTGGRARNKTEGSGTLHKARSPSNRGGDQRQRVTSGGTQEIDLTASDAPPEPPVMDKAGASPICQYVLRLLIAVAYDRLLSQSKAVQGLQNLLDVTPRDEYLAVCFNAKSVGFRDTLQAYFRSVLVTALMKTLRERLAEGGAAALLSSSSHHKLSHNLPRFFGLLSAMPFLARHWTDIPQLPSVTQGLPPRDFWLLHSMQLLVDLLSLVVVPAQPGESVIGANFRAKQSKSGALGDLFGLSKWMGDELDEWITSAIDAFRKLLLTGLSWLEDGLEEATVRRLFEFMLRHLGLLLPQAQSPRAAEGDRQFIAALLFYLYDQLLHEKTHYREAAMYVWRELLTSAPQRKVMESLLSVPIHVPSKTKKDQEKVIQLNLLTFNGSSDGEGFDLMLKVNVAKFSFLQDMSAPLPPPRHTRGAPALHDFADKEFQSWLGSLDPKIRRDSENNLERVSREFRNWSEATASSAIQAYRTNLATLEKKRLKSAHEVLKTVTRQTAGWRRELQTKQDLELRRQVRWKQERLDRETFGARQMDVLFSELIDGCSLATTFSSVLGLERAAKRAAAAASSCSASSLESPGGHAVPDLSVGLVLESQDGELLEGMAEGVGHGDLCLDSAEGPMRVRKKLIRSGFKLGPGPAITEAAPASTAEAKADEPASTGATAGAQAGGQGVDLAWQGDASVHDDYDFFEEDEDVEETEDEEEDDDEEEGGEEEEEGEEEGDDAAAGGAKEAEALPAKRGHLRLPSGGRPPAPPAVPEKRPEEPAAVEEEEDKGEDLVGADDKLKPFLVPGDGIRARYNCARVQGVYSRPGILLLCDGHLYLIDNYKLELIKDPAARTARPMGGGGGNKSGLTHQVVEISASPSSGGGGGAAHMTSGETGISWATSVATSLTNEPVLISPQLRSKCTPDGAASGPSHRCLHFSFEEVTVVYRRRYLLRHVAIEVFLSNGGNHLIIFDSPEIRQEVYKELMQRCESALHDHSRSPFDEIQNFLNITNPNSLTEKWVRGEISNFQYLMHLNTLAGRSYNDLTQYPVFPWVIADWTSEELDLNNPATFRDLTKPMGALNPAREVEFRERYDVLREAYESAGGAPEVRPPFHCGTHYSSAGIVLYYMIRIQPFAEQHVRLQSGRFDHPDRLFASMHKSWLVASGGLSGSVQPEASGSLTSTNTQDVRELTPEFFYMPDFLENKNRYDFGKEANGGKIDDVVLPPWAKGSAQEFIRLHRMALESDYVSRNLHAWIDLIFGNKQRPSHLPGGSSLAEEHCNVFYYLTYEGAIDLESVEDPNLRKAYVEQIHEFGQTPAQLFKQPHPARLFPVPPTEKETGPTWLKKLPLMRTSGAYGPAAAAAAMMSTTPPPDEGSSGYLLSRHSTLSVAEAFGSSEDGGYSSSDAAPGSLVHRPSSSVSSLQPAPLQAKVGSGARLSLDAYRQVEVKKLLTSELSLRVLPPRKLLGLLPHPVVVRAEASARQLNLSLDSLALDQRAIGQLLCQNDKVLTLNVGCAGIPPSYTDHLSWGFMDDCLRVSNVTPNDQSIAPERKATYALDSAGPVSVVAISQEGRLMITGSAVQPVLHLWSLHRLAKKQPSASSSSRRQPPLTNVGTLVSTLHSGAITHVALGCKYGILVSICSQNRAALLWDLNRRRLVRRLRLHKPKGGSGLEACYSVHVDEVTGSIVVTVGTIIHFFDTNGTPLAARNVCSDDVRSPSPISACCVSGDGCLPTVVLTGHVDGTVRVWALELGKWDGRGELLHEEEEEDDDDEEEEEEEEEAEEGRHKARNSLVLQAEYPSSVGRGSEVARPPITAVFMPPDQKRFLAGDAHGNVSVWSCLPPPPR